MKEKKRRDIKTNELISKIFIFLVDLFSITISIYIVLIFKNLIIGESHIFNLLYLNKTYLPLYTIIFIMFLYDGIYTFRFDFWHETRLIVKSLFLSFFLYIFYINLINTTFDYFNIVILLISIFMIPYFKLVIKRKLFKLGYWKRGVKVISKNSELKNELFNNKYLGYIKTKRNIPHTIFIDSKGRTSEEIKDLLESKAYKKKQIIFIPLVDNYQFSGSEIYELSNSRKNLIVLENRLKSQYRNILKKATDYFLAILLLPILIPIIFIIAFLIKKESPGPIFYAHYRMGKNGKKIGVLKFRSMFSDSQERLKELLETNQEIKEEWEKNFKLKNDPRVTKIGSFIRKTSLDELPQIFNVLKGEMSFVGPRPVVEEELEKYYQEDAFYYNMVKPGITGLWQVSGRSETDYEFRVSTDKWYVRNWSVWIDIEILFKTITVVLKREGAY